jgi:hypothetical protein
VHLTGTHPTTESAWNHARAVFRACAPGDPIGVDMPDLDVVGEYTLPPSGAPVREFQTLHIDFGLPIRSRAARALARFTALHVDPAHATTTARTRIVALRPFLRQRAWVDSEALASRLRRYGLLQVGEPDDYVEGILARLIEAADGSPELPLIGAPGFLCGLEFDSRIEERAHLSRRGLELDPHERQILIRPGELLLFDNLATAHGRLGSRSPLELRQLCVGYAELDVPRQQVLLGRVLAAFSPAGARP